MHWNVFGILNQLQFAEPWSQSVLAAALSGIHYLFKMYQYWTWRMSKLNYIQHCTSLGPQPTRQVWSRTDEQFLRAMDIQDKQTEDIHAYKRYCNTILDLKWVVVNFVGMFMVLFLISLCSLQYGGLQTTAQRNDFHSVITMISLLIVIVCESEVILSVQATVPVTIKTLKHSSENHSAALSNQTQSTFSQLLRCRASFLLTVHKNTIIQPSQNLHIDKLVSTSFNSSVSCHSSRLNLYMYWIHVGIRMHIFPGVYLNDKNFFSE